MKDELRAMEAYLKELKALKRYKEAETLKEQVGQLKARLSELQAENERLKKGVSLSADIRQEASHLRELLNQARDELSMLKDVKTILEHRDITLEQAAQEFIKAKEGEIRGRVEVEVEPLSKDFESRTPQMVYEKLVTILEKPEWPADIARVIYEKAEEKAQSRLDDEFEKRTWKEALDRFEELKQREWRPFVEAEVSRLGSSLSTLVAELQGEWHLTCDRCQSRVTVHIGPREVAVLLKGERVAQCPQCTDFNPPPAPPFAPHRIVGSALEDLVEAYLTVKGSPERPLRKESKQEQELSL